MTPIKKLAIVVAVQVLILLSVIGFKQYTIWTGDTVLLQLTPVDPRDLFRGNYAEVRYAISNINTSDVAGTNEPSGTVYVELQEGDDGYWDAVAIHETRRHEFDDTVLIEGEVQRTRFDGDTNVSVTIRYGIEQIFIPEGSELPRRPGDIGVEVKISRFDTIPREFLIDGKPYKLERD